MSNAQHTPGPWGWRDDIELVVGAAGNVTGDVVAVVKGQPAEQFGNAQLIAAAPEMLAALEAIVNLARKHRWQVNSDELTPFPGARDAIRKARGEQ